MSAPNLSDVLKQDSNSLNFVRLGLACSVLLTHAFVLSSGDRIVDPFIAWTGYKLGDHAVHAFFVISGLVTAASLDRTRSLTRFLAARFLRIYPAVAVVAVTVAFLIGPVVTKLPLAAYLTNPDTYIYVVRTAFFLPGHPLLPGVFADNPMANITNEPLWTVKYELICYVLLALAGCLLAGAGTRIWRWTATGLVVACILSMTIVPLELKGTAMHLRQFVLCYMLGVSAYFWSRNLPIDWRVLVAMGVATVASGGTRLYLPLVIMFTGYFVIWLATFQFGPARAWANRTDLSYGVYIMHWPVAQVLATGMTGWSVAGMAVTCLAITLALAWASWRWIEEPALRLKPRTPVKFAMPVGWFFSRA